MLCHEGQKAQNNFKRAHLFIILSKTVCIF